MGRIRDGIAAGCGVPAIPYLVHVDCLKCLAASKDYSLILILGLPFSNNRGAWKLDAVYLLHVVSERC